jgi:hypothetical protein
MNIINIIKVEKLKNARKRLAFAKLSQGRLSLNSLLNDINIDLLNKIGEILLEFLNFRYFPKKNKKIGGGKRRKNHKKKKSKNKHKQRSKTKKNRKYKSRRRRR